MSKKADDIQEPFVKRISKAIPGVNGQKAAAAVEYGTIVGGWKPVSTYPLALWYEDSIDLSGYNLQQLTFYPEIGFNQMGVAHTVLGNDGGMILDATYVTTVPLTDDTDLLSWTIFGGSPALPNFDFASTGLVYDNTQNWETTLFVEQRMYQRNANTPNNLGNMQLLAREQLGSLDPTASDKLFIYRIIIPYSDTGPHLDFAQVGVPPSRVGFIGTMAKEADLEYMMRLKRSYELANQV